MKQQYNKLWFIKDKQINETTTQQYIWKKFLEPHWKKLYFLKNTFGKIPRVAADNSFLKEGKAKDLCPVVKL